MHHVLRSASPVLFAAIAALAAGCNSRDDGGLPVCATCTAANGAGGSQNGNASGDGDGYGYGGYGGGYAYGASEGIRPAHHTFDLPSLGSMAIAFSWRERAGRAAPVDLTLVLDDHVALQVFSRGGQPFVRSGLQVVPLEPSVGYRLAITREDRDVVASVVRDDDGSIVLSAAPVEGASAADVVLPGSYWRANVVGGVPGE